MARINRYTRRTPYEGQLYEYPVEMLAQTLDIAQKRYDQNKEVANTIQDFVIPSLPQDREKANELQTKYATQVDDIIKSYSGDYSKASNKLQELTRSIKKDFNPGGIAHAITGNYTNYTNWLKGTQELIEKGKVLGEDLNIANAYYMKNYKGIGEFDPIKGSYNVFTPDNLSEYVNPDSIIQDVYKNFKPEKIKVGKTIFQNGLQTYVEQEMDGITADRLRPSFETALSNDPKYSNYITQRAKFLGVAPEVVVDSLKKYSAQRAQDLSYMNKSDIQKSERDPLFLLREKQRLKDESDRSMLGELMSNFQYDPTVQTPVMKQANLSEDWRKAFETSYDAPRPNDPSYTSPTMSGQPLVPNIKPSNKYNDKNLIDVLFSNEFISKTNVDPQLAKEVWKDLVGKDKTALAYANNYGKKPAWTKEFERSFVKAYKNAEINTSRQQPISLRILEPQARENALTEIAGRLHDPASVNVIKVGTNVEQTAESAGLDASELIDTKNNKLKPNDVSYAIGGPGYAKSGFQIHTSKGTFIVVDNDINRSSLSKEISGAFNPLFFNNQRSSDQMMRAINPTTGKVEWVKLERELSKTGNGYSDNLYAIPQVDAQTGQPTNSTRYQTSVPELLKGYTKEYEGALGSGMSKSQQTLYTFFNFLNGK